MMKVIVFHNSEGVLPRAISGDADLIIRHNIDNGSLVIEKNRTGRVGPVRRSDVQRLMVKAACPQPHFVLRTETQAPPQGYHRELRRFFSPRCDHGGAV